ncbi:myo-inositol-1(or 4)-monophosphatase [Novosphingobium capsulatum]|uniref:Myo-inositol-1(Or 4)-monophosphatase n=1 Tax=Novosphingobium capsulatum TaxID=13688 RepID=A0ABU1MTE6_9SPHN|nr:MULTISPECIES: inositol monophosphatase family protein [Novosphingobium]KPF51925.1 inositol monophosphatase [Novosphingobium sp. AAP1]MBB3360068.1 myo-inositol-1(or 4)-monophosphatase [Novosphingobium sp. BK256]MBB3376443.1 myo-inositol-1(or 4)-monophosphatase [Novosphingobium sp. BK280]MBB3380841.1 myo-inositol-1(or 4)-monophosphatase [Novosphingobium sp. BK258]MBB3422507.1 myo-inositol-1(or 4)-monophosphatase [Novosphingobium sp. BK267]
MIDPVTLATIVEEAAAKALALWPGHGHAPRIWDKGHNDPVCEADLAVDSFLHDQLGALLPEAGWLSEESADDPARLERGLCWVVDPVDGTRDFVRGRPGWAVSVALVAAGRPIAAILAAPARDEVWLAMAGQGATRNGVPLVASQRMALSGARMPMDLRPPTEVDLVMVDKPNSIALRMAMVAAAEADLLATWRWGYEWDIAAAALIAQEAGALVTDAHGADLLFNKPDPRAFGVLVSAPAIHEAARALVSPATSKALRG